MAAGKISLFDEIRRNWVVFLYFLQIFMILQEWKLPLRRRLTHLATYWPL